MNKLIATLTAIATLVALLAGAAARADDDNVYSRERLHQLLAPVALYPDTVLTHVLIAATYPIEVVQADRWIRKHAHLEGQEAVNAAEDQDWDPSVRALLAFPDLLARMSEDLLWTQELGEAFLASEEATLDAVQELRQLAWEEGTLRDMEHMEVVREKKYISIQPVRRDVVYVPYYDSRVVYGHWHWSDYPPYYWSRPAHYRGVFYWGYHAPVGDWFYFSGFHWPHRTVVISVNRPYYHYSHRHYGYHEGARFWRHNPHHRRGAHYRNVRVRQQWEQPGQRVHVDRHYRTPDRHREVTERLQQHRSRDAAINSREHNARIEALRDSSGTRLERLQDNRSRQLIERSDSHDSRREALRQNLQREDHRSPADLTRTQRQVRELQRSAPPTRERLQRQDTRVQRITPQREARPAREYRAPAPRVQHRATTPRTQHRSPATRSAPRRER